MDTTIHGNTAEELRIIAKKVRDKSRAERQYDTTMVQARAAAEAGDTELKIHKMTQNFFIEQITPASVPALMTPDEFAKELYLDQETWLDMFRHNGFLVTETDPEVPSMFSIDVNPIAQQRAEMEASMVRRYVEKDVTISWA